MIKKLQLVIAALAVGLVLLLVALFVWPLPEMPREGLSGDFLIRNVAIVDVEAGVLRRNQNVVVRGGKIVSVGLTEPSQVQESLIVIDGTKQYLMPGLWNMHTHSTKLSSQYQHPLFIANGVTGVRDLWGCMSEPDSFFACIEDRQRWNSALVDHSGLSPRYMGQSSYQINGGNEVPEGFPEFFKARNAEEARQLVNYYANAGADILKPYSELSAEAYTAMVEEARRRGLTLQGHRPLSVSLDAALSAGQRSIEHARLFLLECFTGAADFRASLDPLSAYTPQLRARLVDEHDEDRCKTLMTAMAKSNTWWTPTLQTLEMGARAGDSSYRDDPRLKYIPYLFEKLMWTPDADRKVADGTDESGRNVYVAIYKLALRNVGQAHRAGVRILTGTDTFDTYVFPGFSTHDELADLVAAGLSPLDALRTATIDAAIFSGVQDKFGSITVGKTADMILLNENPLNDIRNTQQIDGLFFNGQFFNRSNLDRLLEFAEQRANSIRNNIHILWNAVNSPLLRIQFAD
ncbi:MAG: amidohydrolase family protein [Pseudomonadales bacterium]